MQPVIAKTLEALGIAVNSVVTGDDWSETQQVIDDRSFDLLLWAQHTLPAGDPLWFLSTFFRSDGGSNHANLASPTVDSQLDILSVVEERNERVLSTLAAHTAILEEVPVSNLVTPFWHIGLSDRMLGYEPWGSDYYIIRADLFVDGTTTEVEDATTTEVDEGQSTEVEDGESTALGDTSGSSFGFDAGMWFSFMVLCVVAVVGGLTPY